MRISFGFSDDERGEIAGMYWAAFGEKLGRVLGLEDRARRFIAEILDPTHCICARDKNNRLMGAVGFKTIQGALVGGDWKSMRRHYGLFGAAWRVAALSLLERDTENERFLMDGIFVKAEARGLGVGTALLAAFAQEARERGYQEIRLDVIDTNPRARALYERLGFEAKGTQTLGPLRHLFGFASATTMVKSVAD